MIGKSIAYVMLIVVMAGCTGGGNSAAPQTATTAASSPMAADLWQPLRRPIALPKLNDGGTCPVTPSRTVSAAYGSAQSDGHVYSVGLGAAASLRESHPVGGWYFFKTLWVSDAAYAGPVLVRGRQIDGTHEVRFEGGADPPAELRLPLEASARNPDEEPGWRAWPSETLIQAPGCYAFQVDVTDSSETIVFEVAP